MEYVLRPACSSQNYKKVKIHSSTTSHCAQTISTNAHLIINTIGRAYVLAVLQERASSPWTLILKLAEMTMSVSCNYRPKWGNSPSWFNVCGTGINACNMAHTLDIYLQATRRNCNYPTLPPYASNATHPLSLNMLEIYQYSNVQKFQWKGYVARASYGGN